MVLRFIEFGATLLIAAFIITKVLAPLLMRKRRASERDKERAARRRSDAENRLHAAIEEEEASKLLEAAGKIHPASDFSLNMKWVSDNRSVYLDEWVALKDGKLQGNAPSRRALQEEMEQREDLREILFVHMDFTEPEKGPGAAVAERKA
jgi:hypothetical protein